MSKTCGTCRFWAKGSIHYECRRMPPVFQAEHIPGSWPATSSDDWCGEHRPQKAPDQQAMDKKIESIPPGVAWTCGGPSL